MFRIQRSVNGKFVVFALSGRIKAVGVAELQRLLESETNDHNLVLDLNEVKLVDAKRWVFWLVAKRKTLSSRIARHISANGLSERRHKTKIAKRGVLTGHVVL
jgi:hypothetical protein